jgi:mono/diheme cytochrome c family protein
MKKLLDLIKTELNENPGRIFGLVYPYILTLILITGLFYLTKVEVLSRQTVYPALLDTTKVMDLTTADGKDIPPVDIKKVSQPDKDLLTKGKELFTANCASCHGEGGNGDGAGGASLNPKPRNYHAAEGWKNGRKISDMYKTLQFGIPGSGMSAYDYLAPADRFALIHFVRTFMTAPPVDTPAELLALEETYSLSKGMRTGGQIPVTLSEKLILSEALPSENFIKSVVKKIENDNSAGALIFRKITTKRDKALTVIMHEKDRINSSKDLSSVINENLNINGFNLKAHSLSAEELQELQNYLKIYYNNTL